MIVFDIYGLYDEINNDGYTQRHTQRDITHTHTHTLSLSLSLSLSHTHTHTPLFEQKVLLILYWNLKLKVIFP